MIEIQGLHNTALCYTPALEPTAEMQIKTVCDQEAFTGCKIRIMPDVHAGKGCTINSTAIHCTTAPADLLMEKCKANLKAGYRPVIITIYDRVHTALTQIEDAGMQGQVDVWDIQQFLSSNVMEHSGFNEGARNHTLAEIVDKYNAIIDAVEHDPSLHIVFEAQ